MISAYWGIQRNVFSSELKTEEFFGGQAHEEALARSFYQIESHKPLGLLVGESGTGKTLMLHILKQQAALSGREVAMIDLCGLDGEALNYALAEELRLAPRSGSSILERQQLLQNYFKSLRLSQGQLVMLLDNFQLCDTTCLIKLQQILNTGTRANQCITTILATNALEEPEHFSCVNRYAGIKMSLLNWSARETERYIEQTLRNAGAQRTIFHPSASLRIFQLTQGLPRNVKQLCEYSLILGADQNARQIDSVLVEAAAELLQLALPDYSAGLTANAVA